MFNLVSFKLDPAAQVKGLLSINQLQNAVRLSTDKKDKICMVDNKIIVLVARSNPQSVPNLLGQIQNHFPSVDENYLSTVLEYISMMNIEIDESISNAESMMEYIVSSQADSEENYVPLNKFTG
jgi:circadian clock protein KaiC